MRFVRRELREERTRREAVLFAVRENARRGAILSMLWKSLALCELWADDQCDTCEMWVHDLCDATAAEILKERSRRTQREKRKRKRFHKFNCPTCAAGKIDKEAMKIKAARQAREAELEKSYSANTETPKARSEEVKMTR